VIAAPKLQALLTASKAADHRAAEERGAAAAKIKAAVESDYLDQRAFAIVKRLSKLDSHVQVLTLRNISLYSDLCEVGTQMDIEDAIKAKDEEATASNQAPEPELGEAAAAAAAAETGETVSEAVETTEKVRGGRRKNRIMTQFLEALDEADSIDAVSETLDQFVEAHPDFEDDAIEAARTRLKAIGEAQSGGEDLRPERNTEAGKLDAREAEKATEGKKARGRSKKPRSPAAEAAADLGVGETQH
jgi:hypothetical protein